MSWSEYFSRMILRDKDFPELPVRRKPCHDCAVTCGFYLEISTALRAEPKSVQEQVAAKWFCHNDRHKACRGNVDFLEKGSL